MCVVRLPLHLWTTEILKRIGENCGGFITINKDTTLKTQVIWARILVRVEGKTRPSMIHIQAGARSYELHVWWELPPWCSRVFSSRNYRAPASQRQEEEDEGPSCADQHVWSRLPRSQNCNLPEKSDGIGGREARYGSLMGMKQSS